jgi:hypothetical protein
MSQPIPPAPPEFADPKSAKAQAKAEKAYRKASRPFYKKKRFILLALIALIVVIVVATSGGGESGSSPSSAGGDSSSTGNGSSENAVGLNQAARDGKFEFTVTGQDCSKNTIGEDPLSKTAQGTFCVVSLTVKNIGNKAQLLDASSQKALDAGGNEYSADSSAAMYLGDTNTFLNQLNPGSTVNGQIAYDVPVGTQLTELELHDSPFSGGVTVNIG